MAKKKISRISKQPLKSQLNLADIKRIERERFREIDIGKIDHRLFLRPCNVRILMLVDNGISYNQFYLGSVRYWIL